MKDKLTIFYDGQCPMCCLEMDKLVKRDKDNRIELVNIHNNEFLDYPDINKQEAMRVLHGRYQGNLLLALDVTHRAWQLVGLGFWVAPLQWPVIKPMAHQIYLLVAKYRHPISSFLHRRFGLGKAHCDNGVCYDKRFDVDNRGK